MAARELSIFADVEQHDGRGILQLLHRSGRQFTHGVSKLEAGFLFGPDQYANFGLKQTFG